jgi:antitoxin CptB
MTQTIETARDIRIKQLKFRAWRRGFREHDFLMGTYADEHLDNLSDEDLDNFDALLQEQDWDVYYWIIGQLPAPEQFQTHILTDLQSFASLKETLWKGDINS